MGKMMPTVPNSPLIYAGTGPQAEEDVAKAHLILIKTCRGARLCAHKPCFINGEREFRDRLKPVPKLPLTRNLGQPTFATPSKAHGPGRRASNSL